MRRTTSNINIPSKMYCEFAGLLGLIGSMGGATAEQLAANLGLPPGHAGVASALDQVSYYSWLRLLAVFV